MIRFLSNVKFKRMIPTLGIAINIFAQIREQVVGVPLEMVITSGNDSKHRDGSQHYLDGAVDIRSHDLTMDQKLAVLHQVREAFKPLKGYPELTIILEDIGQPNEHFHVQVGTDGIRPYWEVVQ